MTTTLQRLIFPLDRDPDVLPLYAEGTAGRVEERYGLTANDVSIETPGKQRITQVLSRYSYRVEAGERTSFATYFNAFPAAYWAAYTTVKSVRLDITVRGHGMVIVSRSNAKGNCFRIDSQSIASDDATTVSFTLPLNTFGDGGWYWFDVVAEDQPVVVEQAQWVRGDNAGGDEDNDESSTWKATVAVTTFNRPDDCTAMLTQMGSGDDLVDYVDEVIVVDQGTRHVVDADGFATAGEALGDLLRVVTQPNLGGSGGFSRGMMEAMANESHYVLLVDDDVRIEPESIVRAVTFARATRRPTIVGGHMFSMYQRTTLHAWAEAVRPESFWWLPVDGTHLNHDFAAAGLRATPWLHERVDGNYNGWWMCLIPTQVVRDIGLSLPLFIKWDDAEYGVRALEAGVPTVSLPGAALWHVPWAAKDDTLDWQAYFHARNRLIAALLHSDRPHGGRVVASTFAVTVKHILSAQYSVSHLRALAIRDILCGPEHLFDTLPHALGRIRDERSTFTDAQIHACRDDLPPSRAGRMMGTTVRHRAGAGAKSKVATVARGALHQLRRAHHGTAVDIDIPFPAQRWWTLIQYDSAVVSNSDGSGFSVYRRDRARAVEQIREASALSRELWSRWDELAERYREAMSDLVSPHAWAPVMGIPS